MNVGRLSDARGNPATAVDAVEDPLLTFNAIPALVDSLCVLAVSPNGTDC